MKRVVLFLKIFFIIFSVCLIKACVENKGEEDYLKEVLEKLESVNSATYHMQTRAFQPFDTIPYGGGVWYIKEYRNSKDTEVGVSYVKFSQKDTDTRQFSFAYDGKKRVLVYEKTKTIILDDFTARKLSFRPIGMPFFNYTENIIKYILNTEDSINVSAKEIADTLLVSLTIMEDSQIEFFGKPVRMAAEGWVFDDNTSNYKIWINKKTALPFKVLREMSHNVSEYICKNVELNKLDIKNFKVEDYFPTDFSIKKFRQGKKSKAKSNLQGKRAPNWKLKDTKGKIHSLNAIRSKAILLEFMSINCGSCRRAIPFLEKLYQKYSRKDLAIIVIECTIENTSILERYAQKSQFAYPFLKGLGSKALKKYRIESYPRFFLLDDEKVVRKFFRGYGKKTTDKEIEDEIRKLLK